MLTLSKSKKVIDAAMRRARQLNARISVAVCGRDGRLIAFSRMDGCVGWEVDRCSLGVATAAAIIGCPSDQLSDRLNSGLRVGSYSNVVPPRGQHGGLPIMEDGVVEGGCGVSGAATIEDNEECVRAGIAALNALGTEAAIGTSRKSKRAPGRSEPPFRHQAQRTAVHPPVRESLMQAGSGAVGLVFRGDS